MILPIATRDDRLTFAPRTTTGNRGYFVSNTSGRPTSTGLSVSNKNYVGSQDPIQYPIGRLAAHAPKPENPDAIGVFEWRDPDSNRGHHDFQGFVVERFPRAKACKSEVSDRTPSGAMALDPAGSAGVWDSARLSKSQ
jgi:hypothetical protein